MLEISPDLKEYYWEESPNYLDVLTRWLPKKGFKILPKFFDVEYKPDTMGDEADKLIIEAEGCYLSGDQTPIWRSTILELPETREELKRILEEKVLDMDFAKELATYMEEMFGEPHRKIDERAIESSDENPKLGELATLKRRAISHRHIDLVLPIGSQPIAGEFKESYYSFQGIDILIGSLNKIDFQILQLHTILLRNMV